MVEQRFCKAKAIGSNPLAGLPSDPLPPRRQLLLFPLQGVMAASLCGLQTAIGIGAAVGSKG